MAVMVEASTQPWDSILELTKSAQDRNTDPLAWAIQLSSVLHSAQVSLPSAELAYLLVSHICFDNHVPATWKFLEKSLILKLVPLSLVLALLSSKVVPNRRLHPAAYRLYMEIVKRHAFSSSLNAEISGPHYEKIMKSIDDVLRLSHIFKLQVYEPGLLLVEFVFSIVWQLLDASLDDEGLQEHTHNSEKKSRWLSRPQDMEIDSQGGFTGKRNELQERLLKENTTMAIELIGELLKNRVTSRIIYLARRNMPTHWGCFIQQARLLAAHSTALGNSKTMTSEALQQLTSDARRVLSRKGKTMLEQELHAVVSSRSLLPSGAQCHGVTRSALWLPIDVFLEDAMDGSQVAASGAVKRLTGLVKALQAVNGTSWHDTFLGLWIAALRLVQRERDPSEGPVPRVDAGLCILLSITTRAVAAIVDEEECDLMDENEGNPSNARKSYMGQCKCRAGLESCLQLLGEYDSLLTPPQSVSSVANQAAAKANMFISGIGVGNGYYDSMSMNDMPINCSGNLRHLIVESCIARNLLDTSAYLWPGYVDARSNQLPHAVPGQAAGWSSLMKGAPLTPLMMNTLVATPASSLPEVEKIYEIAVHGSDEEKINAATVLCGATLVRGWNIQEHALLFIVRLLSPSIPADYSGSESHLINYAPLLNVILLGISSVDCVQILSLHGLIPILASALMPICEVFGSLNYCLWTLPSGEELSNHAIFSNAFTLLLRLWRFDQPPLERVMGDVPPVGSQLSPEFLLLVRNRQLMSYGSSPRDRMKSRRFSKMLDMPLQPVFMDSFPKLKHWYRQHLECIASSFSGLVHGTSFHQIVDALLNTMFRRINRGAQPVTSTTSGSSNSSGPGLEDAYIRLKIPAWDILEATPCALDAAITACAHGRLSPRDLATGLKDLADFLPASLAAFVSYFSAEVTRGVWKPAFMNGTDWPSPSANLSYVEQQIKKILASTGVDVPSLTVGGSTLATIPLPLAALVSLTITYKLDKASERFLVLVAPALNSLAASCPWPCMPIISSLWAQKVKRWSDFLIFSASRTVFHHNSDAVVQLLESCFTSTLGFCSPHISENGGVGALLGHGFGSHFSGGMSPVAPGFFYLRVHKHFKNVIFLTETILNLIMQSVRKIASSGLPRETGDRMKKTKYGMRSEQVSFAAALARVKLAASLGATLVWISGGTSLLHSVIKETLPSWFISVHESEQEGGEFGGLVARLGGYALAYFAMLCGLFAWGIDTASPFSKRRPNVLGAHLEFLASALDGKITLGCNLATTRAYVTGFMSLMVACTPTWVLELDVELLKRLSKGLRQWNEEELALALLGLGGVRAMGAAAELIIDMQ